ncbi:outer membrane protein transport protein [Pseudomonas sp. AA-38]|uniref:outer membrane protein transport protein n=1 Tax=Pseudomonas sp. AA-38 TaxID=3028807 RepID=UPI0023F949BA|nr:outer membrane protein transport protein [Pseudomonas sp. AA-38]
MRNNNKALPAIPHRALCLATLAGSLIITSQAHAGAFGVPTYGTPGWGRAFAGGSMWENDPSAAFNNPAAMAFINQNIAQVSVHHARVSLKFKGNVYDYQGGLRSDRDFERDAAGNPTGGIIDNGAITNDGGQGGFAAVLPTSFLVMPINDRLSFGLSQVVPMGARTTWDRDWKGQDFAVDTKVETVGLTGSLSFKVNDTFAVGGGIIVQNTKGFISQNIDILAAAGTPTSQLNLPLPSGLSDALIRIKVDNTSFGWFTGVAWKPTDRDTLGLNYHARIRNKLEGKYSFYADEFSQSLMDDPFFGSDQTAVEQAFPGLSLNSNGANAKSRLDVPASATLDWVHEFNDRLSLGASITWTEWSSFKDLKLKSNGNTLVAIPYNYRDSWMYAIGGDYRATDQLTLRAGVALDQTPTRNSTRDARIPDGDRTFVSFGGSYRFASEPNLSIDAAYSRQFVDKARLRTVNQDRLGGARMDGEVKARGDVFSLSATYKF